MKIQCVSKNKLEFLVRHMGRLEKNIIEFMILPRERIAFCEFLVSNEPFWSSHTNKNSEFIEKERWKYVEASKDSIPTSNNLPQKRMKERNHIDRVHWNSNASHIIHNAWVKRYHLCEFCVVLLGWVILCCDAVVYLYLSKRVLFFLPPHIIMSLL